MENMEKLLHYVSVTADRTEKVTISEEGNLCNKDDFHLYMNGTVDHHCDECESTQDCGCEYACMPHTCCKDGLMSLCWVLPVLQFQRIGNDKMGAENELEEEEELL